MVHFCNTVFYKKAKRGQTLFLLWHSIPRYSILERPGDFKLLEYKVPQLNIQCSGGNTRPRIAFTVYGRYAFIIMHSWKSSWFGLDFFGKDRCHQKNGDVSDLETQRWDWKNRISHCRITVSYLQLWFALQWGIQEGMYHSKWPASMHTGRGSLGEKQKGTRTHWRSNWALSPCLW